MFMIVYLLYPGVAQAAFQMFHCRKLEGGGETQIQLLEIDMTSACVSIGGEHDEAYAWFYWLGVLSVVVYPLGIPAYLGYVLYTNRDTIASNPNYITLGGLKPMFIFYKPDCYMWEVYFMIQKVILVGCMGMVQQGAVTNVANVAVSIFMLTILFRVRPSKTEEYLFRRTLVHNLDP